MTISFCGKLLSILILIRLSKLIERIPQIHPALTGEDINVNQLSELYCCKNLKVKNLPKMHFPRWRLFRCLLCLMIQAYLYSATDRTEPLDVDTHVGFKGFTARPEKFLSRTIFGGNTKICFDEEGGSENREKGIGRMPLLRLRVLNWEWAVGRFTVDKSSGANGIFSQEIGEPLITLASHF